MMKKLLFGALAIVMIACSTAKQGSVSKGKYTVVADSADKVLKGYIDRSVLEKDTAFKWFAENMRYGTADSSAVAAFKKHQNFEMVIFGGTWCADTKNLLPVFYRLAAASGYPENKITLVAVDRNKTAPENLHTNYNVANVPTFIVIKDGKEVGRVVEYGKDGQIDKELGEIVTKSFEQ